MEPSRSVSGGGLKLYSVSHLETRSLLLDFIATCTLNSIFTTDISTIPAVYYISLSHAFMFHRDIFDSKENLLFRPAVLIFYPRFFSGLKSSARV